jgi:hypothetical protein
MKLELKHLHDYLLYNVKVQYFDNLIGQVVGYMNQDYCNPVKIIYNGQDNKNINSLMQSEIFLKLEDIKLILRPMTDLDSFLEPLYGSLENQDVTDFLDQDFLDEHQIFDIEDLAVTDPRYMPYGTFQLLIKHHFDIFDLIAQNLAVSIHDVG